MPTKKRIRVSHSKVRTGCHTCKARRVKCDEQRPHCQKCLNTGRKCEGYQTSREWVVIVAPPRPVTDGFEDDRSRRHFDYFRSQAVYELSWYFEGSHWKNLVLQESQTSAAVRHAVIALACCHEDFRNNATVAAQAPQHAYAAQHYSKAIRNLIKETSDDRPESRLRALVCGLLFISIEALRGNNAAALHHLDGCLKIVKEAQERSGMQYLKTNSSETITHLFREIIPMYARLDEQACITLGREPDYSTPHVPYEASYYPTKEGPFSTFHTAFDALESLYRLGRRVNAYTGWCLTLNRQPHLEFANESVAIYGQLMCWEQAVQGLLSYTEHNHDYDKLTLMRIHHRTMTTILECSLDSGESSIDRFQWAFEDVVNFVSDLQERSCPSDYESSIDSDSSLTVDSSSRPSLARSRNSRRSTPQQQSYTQRKNTRPFFVLDSGIIFSLYWTALKCRDGLLRRHAIALLEESSIEGVYVGAIQAIIAKRIVEIEEGQPYEQSPPLDGIRRAEDVPEWMRVHNVNMDIIKEKRMAKLVLLRSGEDGGWCESVEWVSW